jgi:hypothetical protein
MMACCGGLACRRFGETVSNLRFLQQKEEEEEEEEGNCSGHEYKFYIVNLVALATVKHNMN